MTKKHQPADSWFRLSTDLLSARLLVWIATVGQDAELTPELEEELALTAEPPAEPPLLVAAELVSVEGIETTEAGDESEDDANILLDIFIAEAAAHLDVVEDFIRHAALQPQSLELSD